MAFVRSHMNTSDVSLRNFNPRNLLHLDWLLLLLVLSLAIAGWLTMYSASTSSDISHFHKQIIFFVAGFILALGMACMDYRLLVSLALPMYMVSLGLLLAVELVGIEVKGSGRWLQMGPVRLQPSELTKVVMIFFLTWYLTTIGERIKKFHWFALAFLLTGIPMAFILKQPNLGTAASLGPLLLGLLYVAGCRKRHLLLVILAGLSVIPMIWFQLKDFDPAVVTERQSAFELKHYQKQRVYSFLNPEHDIRGSGWQTYQSKITVGSGGMTGRGYLNGKQTRLNYLPEHHTDFIFSLLAEERGFLGASVLIGLFCAFMMRGLMFARDCPDMMGTLLATGAVVILSFHVFVNIAITIGIMPVTGIPLPFLSYGGTFYITTMLCVGILLSVPIRRRKFVH